MLRSVKNQNQAPFELKGSLFTLTVMHLYQTDVNTIDRLLTEKAKQAPGFFSNTPVIIDLEALADKDTAVDFSSLAELLRQQGMVPVGVRNGDHHLHSAAMLAGLPKLPDGRYGKVTQTVDKPATPSAPTHNKLITQPVRSGQQLYAADGDLILLGTISPGAEVLADGNIHIYGPLRGRALAGIKGDTEARIFCQSLEAELVSIAGCYRVSEQLDSSDLVGEAVQIYLLEDRLMITPLNK